MAFNYIYDNYGDLNDNRAITQVVVWALLGAVDVNSEAFENTILTDAHKAAIKDVMENYNGYVGNGKIVDVLFLTDVNTPFNADGSPNYTECQPQIVPVYGTFYVENEPEDEITFEGTVSFNKTKYNGLLPVDADEFAFDLFKKVNGAWEPIGTYYTDIMGCVTVVKLAPGEYKFVEQWTTVFDGGLGEGDFAGSWNLVWKAIYPGEKTDGLYFEIPKTGGDAAWPADYELDEAGNPTVNNVIYSKHNVMWAVDAYDPSALTLQGGKFEVIELGEGKGKIISFTDWCNGTLEVIEIIDPTCQHLGLVWLGCTVDGCSGISLEFGELCAHDFVYLAIVGDGAHDGYVWFGGQNGCVCGGMEYNLEEWYALGGYEF